MTKAAAMVLLVFGVALSQFLYETKKPAAVAIPAVTIPVPVMHSAGLGLDTALASFVWIDAIQHIGSANGVYRGFVNDIQSINSIDPAFGYPYAFAALILPALDQAETPKAIAIGERGAVAAADWRIPFYLASAYLLYMDDRVNATRYFNMAGQTPGVPPTIQKTVLNFGVQKDHRAATREVWVGIYESSRDEILRDQALANIGHIDTVTLLEKAVSAYKRKTGAYPRHVGDLVTAGILREVPEDPLGFTYEITADGTLTSVLKR